MAVGSTWPDFAAATATRRECLDAVLDAIEERVGVARAAGSGVSFARRGGCGSPPALADLDAVRAALLSLAPAFVRTDCASCAWDKWAGFPERWSAAELMTGEHSIAFLPPRGAPEANAFSLARVRSFLSNCAWWLDRMRWIDASAQARFTRLAVASATRMDGSGAAPISCFANPTITELSRPRDARRTALDIALSEVRTKKDIFSAGAWDEDSYVALDESAEASLLSGLSVPNPAGFDARALVFPCAAVRPSRTDAETVVESVIDKWPDDPDGDYYAGSVRSTSRAFAWFGSSWRETSLSEQCVESRWSDGALSNSHSRRARSTAWSADGTRSEVLADATETWSDARSIGLHENHDTNIADFDGCGVWTCGNPVAAGIIPARSRAVVMQRMESVPVPTADIAAMRRMRTVHPRETNTESISFRTEIRLVPILDYHDFFTHHYAQ